MHAGLQLTAAVAAALAVSALPTAAAELRLPDLAADPATNLTFEVAAGDHGADRALLRFDGYVRNAGVGALELRRAATGRVVQRVYAGTGLPGPFYVDRATGADVRFETTDGHEHFHLKDAVVYVLRGASGEVAESAKTAAGFCLRDNQRTGAGGSEVPFYLPEASVPPDCAAGLPDAPVVVMGITPGWRDRYNWFLPLQWIDVSDVDPGEYVLASRVDPLDVVLESDDANNAEPGVPVTVGGFAAQDAVARGAADAPIVVELPARRFVSSVPGWPAPGVAEFRLVRAPAHGSVDLGVAWQPGRTLTYWPAPGFTGTDSFEYQVRDAAHPRWPARPRAKTITLEVEGP